jgi:hypothetical protein
MPAGQRPSVLLELVRAEELGPQRLLVTHFQPFAPGALRQTQLPASHIAMPTLQPIPPCTMGAKTEQYSKRADL